MSATLLADVKEYPPNLRSLFVVAMFEAPDRAETAVAALQSAGFDPAKLSIIAKDAPSGEHLFGCAAIGHQTKFWGRLGPTWNRMAQRLPGAAVMYVPFIANVVILGAVVEWLAEDRPRHGTAEGATPLWRLLARVGVPSHEGSAIELALRESSIVLLAKGDPADVDEARDLLHKAALCEADQGEPGRLPFASA